MGDALVDFPQITVSCSDSPDYEIFLMAAVVIIFKMDQSFSLMRWQYAIARAHMRATTDILLYIFSTAFLQRKAAILKTTSTTETQMDLSGITSMLNFTKISV